MILTVIISIFIALIVLCYVFIRERYQYWSKRGVYCPTPSFPMGNLQGLGVTRHMAEICKDVYDGGKGPFCGMFLFITPTVLIRSPELAKNILIRDFEYFQDRGFYYNERDDPLTAHLFAINGSKWKNLRSKISPTFTTGKMRMMFDTMRETADQMIDYFNSLAATDLSVDVKEIMSRYSTDVIGSCAFGLKCNSLTNPYDAFRRNGMKFFAPSIKQQYSILFGNAFPNLARKLKVCILPAEVSKFFMDVIRKTVLFRKEKGEARKDLMQILIELQKQDETFTDLDLAAQAFVFFIGGSETSASAMTFTLYELALNPDTQKRTRNEISQVLDKYNGEITYDALTDMKYLDQVICESIRKFPPVENIFRKANRDYSVPNTNQVIEKGTMCLIPAYSFHRDEQHFPDPEKFDPERFSDENKAKRHPFAYIPFGDGPRFCIGERFAHMQIRLSVLMVLHNFEIYPSDETPAHITLCKNTAFVSPDRPIVLKFRKLAV